LFPRKMGELIDARAAEVNGVFDARPKLAGMVTALCAVGLTEQQAMDTEEYLVDKYSLSSQHKNGLNMIPVCPRLCRGRDPGDRWCER
ncbi:MAG: hypothetical protein HOM62_21180, partial [Rhodospirillaceae bacterium]|nr:hypothetical protein [Rhodospirillaceae bacterium]